MKDYKGIFDCPCGTNNVINKKQHSITKRHKEFLNPSIKLSAEEDKLNKEAKHKKRLQQSRDWKQKKKDEKVVATIESLSRKKVLFNKIIEIYKNDNDDKLDSDTRAKKVIDLLEIAFPNNKDPFKKLVEIGEENLK